MRCPAVVVGCLLGVLTGCGSASRERPPNVLLVLIDTLRADRLGAYGSERGLTPTLDRLAEESLVFDACWATSSWTLPSIATLLTSNHGAQHGAWLADMRLGDELDTLAEVFASEGYRTGAITGGGWVRREFGLARGFDIFEQDVIEFEDAIGMAKHWVRDGRGEPWFLFLHTYQVHAPYRPPSGDYDRVIADFPEVLTGREPDPLAFRADVQDAGGAVPARIADALEALYDAEVRHTDELLGELLADLERDGLLAETLVVVTADHGEEFGEHALLGHSDSLYVEQLHVPLLVRFPGGAGGGRVDSRPVSQLDLAPTILDAAQLGEARAATFEGVSLLGASEPSPVFASRNHEEAGLLTAVRQGDLVWIEGRYRWARPQSGEELYDLVTDPSQQRELADSRPELAERLTAELARLRERYGDLRATTRRVEVDAAIREQLNALGYND